MKKSIKHIVCSGAIGVAFWIIGELLYPFFTRRMWQPLGIAVYFALFALIMIIGMFVLAVFRGDYNKLLDKGNKPVSDNFAPLIFLLIVFFIITGLFEFLYEIGKTPVDEPTSYVFLIDDSGSMSANDPNCERAVAIKKIMENQDAAFPYAVYKFTDSSSKLKDMSPYRATDAYKFESYGNTNIIGSLNEVIDDLTRNGRLGGSSPRIMLVSDGSSSSLGKSNVIKRCNDNSISISSISFGNRFRNKLLNDLSLKTGGVYVDVDDINRLYDHMQTAITSSASRNLISARFMLNLDWLYAVLRILFLTLMAALWAIMKNLAYCGTPQEKNEEHNSYDNVWLFTVIWAIISIVIMEFGIKYLNLPEKAARCVLAIFWMMIPGRFFEASKGKAHLTSIGTGKPAFESEQESRILRDSKGGFDTDKKILTRGEGFKKTGGGFGQTPSGFGQASTGFGPKGGFNGSFGSQNGKPNAFGEKKDSSGAPFDKD